MDVVGAVAVDEVAAAVAVAEVAVSAAAAGVVAASAAAAGVAEALLAAVVLAEVGHAVLVEVALVVVAVDVDTKECLIARATNRVAAKVYLAAFLLDEIVSHLSLSLSIFLPVFRHCVVSAQSTEQRRNGYTYTRVCMYRRKGGGAEEIEVGRSCCVN